MALEESPYYTEQEKFNYFVERISSRVRGKIYKSFNELVRPTAETTILDVGVTCNRRADSNFFEARYPYSNKITAVGLEDASFLEEMYPGLRYLKADAQELPFADNAFDVAVSWAVIEHVGSREKQRSFLAEISRVSKAIFITTPNRWYPVEFHTVLPLLHWLPPETFRSILTKIGKDYFAQEENLNLLDEKEFFSLLPSNMRPRAVHARLFGPVSNLVLYATKE
ncbi:MAG: methyltransferase domain-containing protein [Cyanobacteria bacterium SZAS TMP-1]|nr:methyltransferase domain-containing protein [Cyanobacteria bacterium SZAS TMP-1]